MCLFRIAEESTVVPDLDVNNPEAVCEFCREKSIGLVVIGPEAPLIDGLADHLRSFEIPTFGPSSLAAELEGSKVILHK